MNKLGLAVALAAAVALSGAAFGQVSIGGPGGPKPLTRATPAAAPKAAKPKSARAKTAKPTPPKPGLPKGEGVAEDGRNVYAQKCAICHSGKGETGPGVGMGQCWVTTSALFGYVKRAMPLNKPGSLTDNEAYSLVAYLLSSAGIIDENLVMDARSLPMTDMPAAKAAVLPSYCGALQR